MNTLAESIPGRWREDGAPASRPNRCCGAHVRDQQGRRIHVQCTEEAEIASVSKLVTGNDGRATYVEQRFATGLCKTCSRREQDERAQLRDGAKSGPSPTSRFSRP